MFRTLLGFLLLATLVSSARSDEKKSFPDYQPVANWPTLPPKLVFGPVSAVATDSADRVFIAHRAAKPVLVFDRDGKFIRG